MFKKLSAAELRHRIDRAFMKLYALDQPVPAAPVVIRSGLAVKPLPFDQDAHELECDMRHALLRCEYENIDMTQYFLRMPPPRFIEGKVNG